MRRSFQSSLPSLNRRSGSTCSLVIPQFNTALYYCSSSSSPETKQTSTSTTNVLFLNHFWDPVNNQRDRNNGQLVKEFAQKFQMVGHVQKLQHSSSSTVSNQHQQQQQKHQFAFNWLGLQTNHPQVVEDFLIFLSTGFDIIKVNPDTRTISMEHTRNFLGWKPKPVQIVASSPSASSSDKKNVDDVDNEIDKSNPNLISLPFESEVELVHDDDDVAGSSNDDGTTYQQKFSHISFNCDLINFFNKNTDCPQEILSCLATDGDFNEINREPVKMVVALRKAGVRPEIISHRALKSATKKTSTWASALGVL